MNIRHPRMYLGLGLLVGLLAATLAPRPWVRPWLSPDAQAQTPVRQIAETQLSSQAPTPTGARRVVALTSLTADLIQRLDPAVLVGRPGSSLLEADPRFAELPTVSTGRTQPNLETVVALEPDLVIGAAGFHEATLERLAALGIETLTTEVRRWQDLSDLVQALAGAIAADPAPVLADLPTLPAVSPDQAAPATLVLLSQQPILTPNAESWAGDLLARWGFANLAAQQSEAGEFRGYLTLDPEAILAANPEVLLLVDTGDNPQARLESQPFWSQLQATQQGQVYVLDYFGIINPGSVAAIQDTAEQLQAILSD